jgi:hypothetical protein
MPSDNGAHLSSGRSSPCSVFLPSLLYVVSCHQAANNPLGIVQRSQRSTREERYMMKPAQRDLCGYYKA